jgi:hypothetical protein
MERRQKGFSPTEGQRKIALELVKNAKRDKPLNYKSIMEKAGYSKNYIHGSSKRAIFDNVGVKKALEDLGVTPEKLIGTVDNALDATQGTWFQGEYRQNDAPDHKIRLSAANLLADIVGVKKYNVQQTGVNVNIGSDELNNLLGF